MAGRGSPPPRGPERPWACPSPTRYRLTGSDCANVFKVRQHWWPEAGAAPAPTTPRSSQVTLEAMAYGKTEQIERGPLNNNRSSKSKYAQFLKKAKHRVERRRAKRDPE